MTKVNEGHLFIYLRARKKAETRAKNRKEAAVVMQADKGRRLGRGGTEKTTRKKGGRKGTARPNLAARTQAGENMTHGRRRGKHDAWTQAGKTRRTDAGGGNGRAIVGDEAEHSWEKGKAGRGLLSDLRMGLWVESEENEGGRMVVWVLFCIFAT